MKRMLAPFAAVAFIVAPLAAQSFGMPNWSSPKGGTGITISGDLGLPNSDLGKGTAFGARGSIGLANINLMAAVASWKPKGATDSYTSVGGQAAFRVIGGSLIPVSVSLQVNAARASAANTNPAQTRIGLGGAVSVNVPTPGLSIEPYLAVSPASAAPRPTSAGHSGPTSVSGCSASISRMTLRTRVAGPLVESLGLVCTWP